MLNCPSHFPMFPPIPFPHVSPQHVPTLGLKNTEAKPTSEKDAIWTWMDMVELQQLYFHVTNSNLKSFDHEPVGPWAPCLEGGSRISTFVPPQLTNQPMRKLHFLRYPKIRMQPKITQPRTPPVLLFPPWQGQIASAKHAEASCLPIRKLLLALLDQSTPLPVKLLDNWSKSNALIARCPAFSQPISTDHTLW